MSTIPGGVKLTGFIAPNDSTDTFPVFKPIYGLGGLRTVDALLDRDVITNERREEGMMVYVKSDKNYYQLSSGLTNSDWVNLNFTNGGSSYGSQVTVSASGPDFYIGTSNPPITGYTISTIFLTQFDSTNSITGTTIDIDGYGVLDLVKGTDSGLSSLEIGEIQTGVTYFLTYDGTQMQFFTSSPEGTVGTYTSLNPATVAVGGIPVGTTFSGSTWQSIFDTMFHPNLTPAFSSFVMRNYSSTASTQAVNLEVGDSVSGGTRVFTWGTTNSIYVKPNTIKIYNVTTGNAIISTPSSGIPNDGNEVISGLANVRKTVPTSHLWRIYSTRTNNSTFSANFQVNWYWKRFFGVSSAATMPTSADVNVFNSSGVLSTVIAGTYSLNGPGYKYIFVPSTFAYPALFKDASTQLSVSMATVLDDPFFGNLNGNYYYGITPVTNVFGVTQNYRVYRTRNFLNGNIIITIS